MLTDRIKEYKDHMEKEKEEAKKKELAAMKEQEF